MSRRSRIVHLEDLLGSRVRGADGVEIGRIKEVRADRHGDDYEVTDYLVARDGVRLIARWDQLEIRNPASPKLTCPIERLKREP